MLKKKKGENKGARSVRHSSCQHPVKKKKRENREGSLGSRRTRTWPWSSHLNRTSWRSLSSWCHSCFGRLPGPDRGHHPQGSKRRRQCRATQVPSESVAALVLAFRAIALASVYLRDVTASNTRCRSKSKLFYATELFRQAWARFRAVASSRVRTAGGVRFLPNELDGVALVRGRGPVKLVLYRRP